MMRDLRRRESAPKKIRRIVLRPQRDDRVAKDSAGKGA